MSVAAVAVAVVIGESLTGVPQGECSGRIGSKRAEVWKEIGR